MDLPTLRKYAATIPSNEAIILKKEYLPGETHAGFLHGIRQAPHYAGGDFQNLAALVQQMARGAGGLFLQEDDFDGVGEYFEQHRFCAEVKNPLLQVYVELQFRQSLPQPRYLRSANLYLRFREEGEKLFKSAATQLRHVNYISTPVGGEGYSVTFK